MLPSQEMQNPEHREWNREHVSWLEDLQRWQAENRQARAVLAEIIERLAAAEETYEHRRLEWVKVEQEIHRHEHGHGDDHEECRRLQVQLAQSHEELASKHLEMMMTVEKLNELLAG